MAIKPTSGNQPPIVPGSTSTGTTQAPKPQGTVDQSAMAKAAQANPEAYAKAVEDYKKLRQKLKDKPMLSGAANLFTSGIVFPDNLLDPNNPINDPKYLHLLCSMFGLDDLEQFFATAEQREEREGSEEDEEEPEAPQKVKPVPSKPAKKK